MTQEKKKITRPAQIILVLRLIAGVYLVYLAYGLFGEALVSSGGRRVMQIACMLLFFLVGAVLTLWSGKKLIRGEFLRPGQTEEDFED